MKLLLLLIVIYSLPSCSKESAKGITQSNFVPSQGRYVGIDSAGVRVGIMKIAKCPYDEIDSIRRSLIKDTLQ